MAFAVETIATSARFTISGTLPAMRANGAVWLSILAADRSSMLERFGAMPAYCFPWLLRLAPKPSFQIVRVHDRTKIDLSMKIAEQRLGYLWYPAPGSRHAGD